MTERPIDPIAIDVGEVLQGTVASLYAHLVTRPTGRAVRMAIETQLEQAGAPSLSLIDLSEVVIIDFSCADEVVAKLMRRHREDERDESFFVFRGVREPHRDQIEAVLERHGLAAVAETEPGHFELIGVHSDEEGRAWRELEERGALAEADVDEAFADAGGWAAVESLSRKRLVYRGTGAGSVHALSRLIQHLM